MVNRVWDFVDDSPSSEATALSSLVVLGFVEVRIQRFSFEA